MLEPLGLDQLPRIFDPSVAAVKEITKLQSICSSLAFVQEQASESEPPIDMIQEVRKAVRALAASGDDSSDFVREGLSQLLASPSMHPNTGVAKRLFEGFQVHGKAALQPMIDGLKSCFGDATISSISVKESLAPGIDANVIKKLREEGVSPIPDSAFTLANDWAVKTADGLLQIDISCVSHLMAVFTAFAKLQSLSSTIHIEGLSIVLLLISWDQSFVWFGAAQKCARWPLNERIAFACVCYTPFRLGWGILDFLFHSWFPPLLPRPPPPSPAPDS